MKLLRTLIVVLIRLPVIGVLAIKTLTAVKRHSIEIMKRAAKNHVRARNWSNAELRKFSSLYSGSVINVSGWKDEDMTGGHYAEYFSNAGEYVISNYPGERGYQSGQDEISLDLETEPPEGLKEHFQVVFNHTTLEHIYRVSKAIANLCAMSSDTVIIVTPFLQQVHYEEGSYGDYWRFTPMCLEKIFKENGLEVLYQSTNDNDWYIVYVFTVASKRPDLWRDKITFERPSAHTGCGLFGLSK